MSDRTPSEKIWSDLESQLSAMDHAQLVRICAHLIRTYVVEDHRSVPPTASSQPAASARTEAGAHSPASVQPSASSPFGGTAERPKPVKDDPPRDKPQKQEPGYNKLEMD